MKKICLFLCLFSLLLISCRALPPNAPTATATAAPIATPPPTLPPRPPLPPGAGVPPRPTGKCGDGICDELERTNPNLCPGDCQKEAQGKNIPYYFIAIHNEPSHRPGGEEEIAKSYIVLKQMVEKANKYRIKLTLMFSAQWADYISASPERMAELESWKKQGHEIAGHHHSIYHGAWDGYTAYSKEEAEKQRTKQGKQAEEYLGTLKDYINKLKKINPNIKSGCMNDETDKKEMPDEIIYDTCSGFANYDEPGRRESDSTAEKGKNEFISVGVVNGIERKWLAHFQIVTSERQNAAQTMFSSMTSGVYGVVTHSVQSQAEEYYKFLEFLHSKDPNAEKSRTLSQIIEQRLLPQKTIPTDLLVEPSQPSIQPQPLGRCGDGICDAAEKANPNLCPKDCGGQTTQPTLTILPTSTIPPSPYQQTLLYANWEITDMGGSPVGKTMNGISIANGRNDGINRVYSGSFDGHVYEFTYNGTSWTKMDLGQIGKRIDGIAAGNGRNDGVVRIYAAERATPSGRLFELTYTAGEWRIDTLGTGAKEMRLIAIGPGRNDGINRVYATNFDDHIYEFTWTGTSWSKLDMGIGGADMCDIRVADGRNDGRMRVYASNHGPPEGHLYEFTWNGTSYTKVDMGAGTREMCGLDVGSGRNDGTNRVYAGNHDYRVYEFSYSGGNWIKQEVGSGVNVFDYATVGEGRSDSVKRVYATNFDARLYEFTWTGTSWSKQDMGQAGRGFIIAKIGDGRNDGKLRVYASNMDGHMYEYTYNPTGFEKK